MIKNDVLKNIFKFSMPILILFNYLFRFDNYIYFVFVFLIYSLLNRLNNKNNIFLIFMWWYLIVPIADIDTLYFSLVMGLLGNLIGYIIIKGNNIELNNDDNNKHSRGLEKIGFVFPILIFAFIEVLYFVSNPNQYYSLSFLNILLNLVLIYLFWFIVLSFTKTTFRSNVITTIIMFLFFGINQLKIYFTSEPVSATDLIMITQTGEIMNIIKGNVLTSLYSYRKVILLALANIIFLFRLFKICDSDKLSSKIRFSFLIAIPLFFLFIFPDEWLTILVADNIYKDPNITKLSSLNDYYGAYRMVGGLYGNYLSTIDYSQNVLDERSLEQIYSEVSNEEDNIKEFKKPNIIVMFTESFWDITSQKSILFDVDPLKEYHEVKEEAIVINTLSPAFGGKSANTEFEFLTGGALSYFQIGTVAYETYYKVDEAHNNPTIIKELNNNGYTTEILNAATSELFSCGTVYPKMKVSKVNHLYDELGVSVKDKYLVDKMIERFESKSKDEKLFYMTISMESHMPYRKRDHDHFDFNIVSDLRADAKNMISAYTQSIRNASIQLKRAYEYIKTLDEETIIIFYGDHLPFLRLLDKDIYSYIKEFNTGDRLLDTYKKYNTETLILSNYDIDYNDLTDMSVNLIFPTIINNMDIEVSDYYKWLYSIRKKLPAANGLVAKDLEGNLYDVENLPRKMQTTYDLRKKIQKYLFK